MKKNLLKFLGLGMLFVVFTACPQDECKDKNCGDNGVCVEGICLCDDGYEQDATGACTVESRTKFLGTWSVAESCSNSGDETYVAVNTNGTEITEVSIANFYGLFTSPVIATVDGNNITITRDNPLGDDTFVEGSGTFDTATGKVTLNYTVSDESVSPAVTNTCTSVWSK